MFRREPDVRPGARPAPARWARSLLVIATVGAVAGGLVACDGSDTPTGTDAGAQDPQLSTNSCTIPEDEIFDGGVGRGGIPALTDPKLVNADDPEAGYLLDSDRVIGVRLDQGWVAVPHNILWWHEVLNFTRQTGGTKIVTYCPLTGSNLFFAAGRVAVTEFIVSGLLFHNNLMMLDPATESLWPQMSLGARCGPRTGATLPLLPSIEMTWQAWRELHPDTKVVSGSTGFNRDYTLYPYGNYENLNAPPLFPERSIDGRRPIKERVLGIPAGEDGIAFPFLSLQVRGSAAVVEATTPGEDPRKVVVFWDGEAEAAMAYDRRVNRARLRDDLGGDIDQENGLSFEARDGRFVDLETGSAWRVDGLAVEGPLAGTRLEPIPEAHVAFWCAWAAFHPGTTIWHPAN